MDVTAECVSHVYKSATIALFFSVALGRGEVFGL